MTHFFFGSMLLSMSAFLQTYCPNNNKESLILLYNHRPQLTKPEVYLDEILTEITDAPKDRNKESSQNCNWEVSWMKPVRRLITTQNDKSKLHKRLGKIPFKNFIFFYLSSVKSK